MITDEQLRDYADQEPRSIEAAARVEIARELLQLRNQVRVQLVAAALSGAMVNADIDSFGIDECAELAVKLADATMKQMVKS